MAIYAVLARLDELDANAVTAALDQMQASQDVDEWNETSFSQTHKVMM